MNKKENRIKEIDSISSKDNFWSDRKKAVKLSKEREQLSSVLDFVNEIKNDLNDFEEFFEFMDQDNEEFVNFAKSIQQKLKKLEIETLFFGEYDNSDAILTLRSGAGGTDAQDWTSMLLRMYVLWANSKEFSVNDLEKSYGQEAGLKSVSIEIKGQRVYGFLKSEMGVHRLVRLSPFNSDNLRQTSFAEVEVMPIIDDDNEDFMLNDKDLRVDVFRASGAGGQHVNTTDSAVRITHLPSGIVVSCQSERSQLQNKENAMKLLKAKLNVLKLKEKEQKMNKIKGERQNVEWGSQIRSYVLHPYKLVKDHRTKHETKDVESVLNGNIDDFIEKYLYWRLSSK